MTNIATTLTLDWLKHAVTGRRIKPGPWKVVTEALKPGAAQSSATHSKNESVADIHQYFESFCRRRIASIAKASRARLSHRYTTIISGEAIPQRGGSLRLLWRFYV